MNNFKIILIIILIFSNISFSFGIVWVEHLTRTQYRNLQKYTDQKYKLLNERNKLRNEVRAYASHSKIEKDAINKSNMKIPKTRRFIRINE